MRINELSRVPLGRQDAIKTLRQIEPRPLHQIHLRVNKDSPLMEWNLVDMLARPISINVRATALCHVVFYYMANLILL